MSGCLLCCLERCSPPSAGDSCNLNSGDRSAHDPQNLQHGVGGIGVFGVLGASGRSSDDRINLGVVSFTEDDA